MRSTYTKIQHFLDDDSFVKWAVLGEDNAWWQRFLAENPAKAHLVREARQLILAIQKAEEMEKLRLDPQSVWARITAQLGTTGKRERTSVRAVSRLTLWQWAAAFILMAGVAWLAWQNRPRGQITYRELVSTVEKTDRLLESTNRSDAPLTITLDDGSTVALAKNSRLSYPERFGPDQRSVILTGEAFFEVAKDAGRPFYIYSNELVTKVLGTSFRIRAFEQDRQVIVQVRTGRVSVYKQKRIALTDPETEGLVLLPNQQAIFSRSNALLSRQLVASPVPLVSSSPGTPPRRYDEVSASKILRDIQDRYGISMVFNDDILSHCILTTTLGDGSLYEQLDLICKTIGATYKEVDAQIVIESQGCPY